MRKGGVAFQKTAAIPLQRAVNVTEITPEHPDLLIYQHKTAGSAVAGDAF
jgi:hypothetical protein